MPGISLMVLQLLLSRPVSVIQAIIGLLVGVIYHLDLFGMSTMSLPAPFLKLYKLYALPHALLTIQIGARRETFLYYNRPETNTSSQNPNITTKTTTTTTTPTSSKSTTAATNAKCPESLRQRSPVRSEYSVPDEYGFPTRPSHDGACAQRRSDRLSPQRPRRTLTAL